MRLVGHVDSQSRDIVPTGQTFAARIRNRFFACDRERVHDSNRGGVVKNATKLVRQTKPMPQPVEHERFQFRRRRRSAPRHGIDVERRRDHVGEQAGRRAGAAEVAHELRMRPMHHAWRNHAIDIGQDSVE